MKDSVIKLMYSQTNILISEGFKCHSFSGYFFDQMKLFNVGVRIMQVQVTLVFKRCLMKKQSDVAFGSVNLTYNIIFF